MKKFNHILNIFMASFIGVYIGHCFSVYSTFQKYPEIYAAQSSPWWVNTLPYGVCTIVIIAVIIIAKMIVKSKGSSHEDKE